MKKQARLVLSECITYRILEAVDKSALLDIEADVIRSVARTAPDRPMQEHEEEAHRILFRAWRRCGYELITEMARAEASLIPPS